MARLTRGDEMRQRRAHPFVSIPNTTIRDRRLSLRARGLLGLLLSQSEDWSFSHAWLCDQVDTEGSEGEGREAIATALRELRKLGYYRVERRHMLRDGTFRSGGYVSDEPVQEWADAYAAAVRVCATKSPRWDVTVRVLADGTVEEEARRPSDAPPDATLCEDETAGGDGDPDPQEPVTGPVPENPVSGSPGDRVTGDPKKTITEDHPEEDALGLSSHVGTAAPASPTAPDAGHAAPPPATNPTAPAPAVAAAVRRPPLVGPGSPPLRPDRPASSGPGRAAFQAALAKLGAPPTAPPRERLNERVRTTSG